VAIGFCNSCGEIGGGHELCGGPGIGWLHVRAAIGWMGMGVRQYEQCERKDSQLNVHVGCSYALNLSIFEFLKYKAFILSLGLLVYLAEFVVIPRMMGVEAAPAVAKSDCCAHKTQGAAGDANATCGGDGMRTAQCGDGMRTAQCGNGMRTAQCPKPGKKCPASADCCLNCPMCTPVDLPAAREARLLPVVERVYPSFEPSYLYLYQASPWKPPNTV